MSEKMLVLIGPEGDFSKEELELAHTSGFKNITLGKSRLRTETAGVFAVTVLNARK
jgi:16S rRNA (uracil1498-N3)-methyltransferase